MCPTRWIHFVSGPPFLGLLLHGLLRDAHTLLALDLVSSEKVLASAEKVLALTDEYFWVLFVQACVVRTCVKSRGELAKNVAQLLYAQGRIIEPPMDAVALSLIDAKVVLPMFTTAALIANAMAASRVHAMVVSRTEVGVGSGPSVLFSYCAVRRVSSSRIDRARRARLRFEFSTPPVPSCIIKPKVSLLLRKCVVASRVTNLAWANQRKNRG